MIYFLNIKMRHCICILFNWTLFVYQATAEQIRLAQMIYDKNDADFEDKVKLVWLNVFMLIHDLDTYLLDTLIASWSELTMFFCFVCLQLIEVTGKTQDECMVALHDCNGDVNRAINFLLESTSDTVRVYIHVQTILIFLYGCLQSCNKTIGVFFFLK